MFLKFLVTKSLFPQYSQHRSVERRICYIKLYFQLKGSCPALSAILEVSYYKAFHDSFFCLYRVCISFSKQLKFLDYVFEIRISLQIFLRYWHCLVQQLSHRYNHIFVSFLLFPHTSSLLGQFLMVVIIHSLFLQLLLSPFLVLNIDY